jgi:phytoene synthase
MLTDILRKPMLNGSDLSLYIYRVAGVVGLLSIEIFGYRNRKSRDFATSLGEALQLTNILRDVAEDARIGRIYLPQADRIRHRVPDQAFSDGGCGAEMRALLSEYADKAEAAYRQALATLPAEDRVSLRPSLVMGSIYYAYLRQLRAIDFDVWRQPVHMLPLKKIWIAWRAWRYEQKAARRGLPLKLEV